MSQLGNNTNTSRETTSIPDREVIQFSTETRIFNIISELMENAIDLDINPESNRNSVNPNYTDDYFQLEIEKICETGQRLTMPLKQVDGCLVTKMLPNSAFLVSITISPKYSGNWTGDIWFSLEGQYGDEKINLGDKTLYFKNQHLLTGTAPGKYSSFIFYLNTNEETKLQMDGSVTDLKLNLTLYHRISKAIPARSLEVSNDDQINSDMGSDMGSDMDMDMDLSSEEGQASKINGTDKASEINYTDSVVSSDTAKPTTGAPTNNISGETDVFITDQDGSSPKKPYHQINNRHYINPLLVTVKDYDFKKITTCQYHIKLEPSIPFSNNILTVKNFNYIENCLRLDLKTKNDILKEMEQLQNRLDDLVKKIEYLDSNIGINLKRQDVLKENAYLKKID